MLPFENRPLGVTFGYSGRWYFRNGVETDFTLIIGF